MEKEKGEERTVAAVNNRTKKYTEAMVIIMIAKKQVKAMIDSGACETIIVLSWVEHLGLKKMIDTRAEVPKDLASAMGEGMQFVGVVNLRVKVGEKEAEWRA